MNRLTWGIWDVVNQSLQGLGKGTARLLFRSHPITDGTALYAAVGGAIVCAIFGGVAGFELSHPALELGVIAGTMLGGLLGVCMGIFFGSLVVTVDRLIKILLRINNSR